IEVLLKKNTEFVRTPKNSVIGKNDQWINKKYALMKFDYTIVIELALALYCLFGVAASIYYLGLAALPFQLLLCMRIGLVGWLSIKHGWLARRLSPSAHKVARRKGRIAEAAGA